MKACAVVALLASTTALAACDSSQVRACEIRLKERLKSPASYKRVSAEVSRIPKNIHDPPYDSVTITYDAANSFNALLRDKETCFFHPGTTEQFDPYGFGGGAAVDMNATLDFDINATDNAIANADATMEEAARAVENANNAIADAKEVTGSDEGVVEDYAIDENITGE